MDEALEFAQILGRHFSEHPQPSPEQVRALYSHYALMVRWNKALNLTRVSGLEESVLRHYCESLFVAVHLPLKAVSVADIGSGAGLPGIPMAVMRPECRFALVESHQRKAVFLREATRAVANVRVLARRAEDLNEEFDWVVSRAVRWDVVTGIARHRIGLLLGQEDAEEALQSGEFRWNAPITLPWGSRRVLLLGERS